MGGFSVISSNQHDQYHKYTVIYHHLRIQGTFSIPGVSLMSSYLCTCLDTWSEVHLGGRLDLGGLQEAGCGGGGGREGGGWAVGRETALHLGITP